MFCLEALTGLAVVLGLFVHAHEHITALSHRRFDPHAQTHNSEQAGISFNKHSHN